MDMPSYKLDRLSFYFLMGACYISKPQCGFGKYSSGNIMLSPVQHVRLNKTGSVFRAVSGAGGNVKPPDWRFRILCPRPEPQKLQSGVSDLRKGSTLSCYSADRLVLTPPPPSSPPLPSPAARLVRAVSDRRGSSILRQGSRRVMLLGNGALTLPIMRQARKPERLSGRSSSARERRCLSGSTCATRRLGLDSSAM